MKVKCVVCDYGHRERNDRRMNNKCVVCGRTCIDEYIVNYRTWKTAGMKDEDECHIDCLSKKLGRELILSDFNIEAPINRMLLFGYLMGRCADKTEEPPGLPHI